VNAKVLFQISGLAMIMIALAVMILPLVAGVSIFGYYAVIGDNGMRLTLTRALLTNLWALSVLVYGGLLFVNKRRATTAAVVSMLLYVVMVAGNASGAASPFFTQSIVWPGCGLVLALLGVPAFQFFCDVIAHLIHSEHILPGWMR
jgi:hypothetical protein